MSAITVFKNAVSGLNMAADAVKAISKLDTSVKVNEVAIQLQQIILVAQSDINSAQAEHFTMLHEMDALKKEVAHLKAWDVEKEKYKLHEIAPSVFTYLLKEETCADEPIHQICPNCYTEGKKSILQKQITSGLAASIEYNCPKCKTIIKTNTSQPIEWDQPKIIRVNSNKRRY